MNEQIINEFVLKARQQAVFDTDKYGKTFDLDLFHKKFAQLIIKETLQVARAGIEYGDGMEDAVYRYFGVEE